MRGDVFTPKRLLLVLGCALVFVVCCGLATWQWQRFMSASGTIQNFGYVLLWPLFGVFPTFMWWRMARLSAQYAAEAAEAAEAGADEGQPDPAPAAVSSPGAGDAIPAMPAPRPAVPVTRAVSAPAFEDDEDEELAAYNRYLAELNARSERRAG